MRGLAHQAAAGVVLRDFRDRTSHVDVDDVSAHAFDDLRGIGHHERVAAEDLNGDRPLLLRIFGVLERAADPAHQALGRNHLSDDEPAAAVAFHEPAECGIRHARHRGERDGIVQLNGSDLGGHYFFARKARPASYIFW